MDDNYFSADLRSKLITAGIEEIEQHGITDFSLRRVAAKCGASCAAPYRHFENKNKFISEIIKYINSRWVLLEEQIEEVYAGDTAKIITELSMALIRFRLANPEFKAVLTIDFNSLDTEQRTEMSHMTEKIIAYINRWCEENNSDSANEKSYVIQSLIYGAVLLCDNGQFEDREKAMEMVRSCIDKQLTINNDIRGRGSGAGGRGKQGSPADLDCKA